MRFEYTEDLKLNYKRFEIENMEWACFIIANRVTERIADELGLKTEIWMADMTLLLVERQMVL